MGVHHCRALPAMKDDTVFRLRGFFWGPTFAELVMIYASLSPACPKGRTVDAGGD
jgi:hypothetical protein